tara:strand:+ start:5017 stop:5610 length:594 start_codon:yes stop_codon:yes gene_type:complete
MILLMGASPRVAEMDEFADLEAEFADDKPQVDMEFVKSLVMSVEYEGLDHGMFITDYRKLWTPIHKISLVLFGILFIPLFGLGVFMIIAGTNKGPIMQDTEIIEAKVYLGEQHAVVSYSMIDEDIGSLAYYPVESGSFIKIERRSWGTDNGTHESVEHLLCSGSEKILLLESRSDSGIKADRKVILELSRLANLPIR